MMFGVSPAYFISRYGKTFGPAEIIAGLPALPKLGYTAFEPEIFVPQRLGDWLEGDGGPRVAQAAQALGISASQYVAHFLLDEFSAPEKLDPQGGIETLKQVISLARLFDGCEVLTIPMPPFEVDWKRTGKLGPPWYGEQMKRLAEKIDAYRQLIDGAGLRLALEILPGALIGGIEGLLRLAEVLGAPRLGINLDTGHAWACREMVPLLPARLAGCIDGVHLCDNNSNVNLSLAPGKGTIDWPAFMANLHEAGYCGSLDIEIVAEPEEVEAEYHSGREFLQSIVNPNH